MPSNSPGCPLCLAMTWSMNVCSAFSQETCKVAMCLALLSGMRDQHGAEPSEVFRAMESDCACLRSSFPAIQDFTNAAGNSVRRVTSGSDCEAERTGNTVGERKGGIGQSRKNG